MFALYAVVQNGHHHSLPRVSFHPGVGYTHVQRFRRGSILKQILNFHVVLLPETSEKTLITIQIIKRKNEHFDTVMNNIIIHDVALFPKAPLKSNAL